MTGTKCLIVEDDLRAAEVVSNIVTSNFEYIEVVGVAENLKVASDKLAATRPQLVILDVNLPDGTAFEFLNSLTEINFKIIFTTAYSKYAIEAFKFSALDFLLKPHSPDELVEAIQKALDSLDEKNYHLQLEAFYHNFKNQDAKPRKLILKNAEAVHLLDIKQIICVQSDNNYAIFFIEDGRQIMVSKPLKTYDQKLSNYGFYRVHQSHLVNLQHVVTFNKRDETLTMAKGIIIPVAQSKRNQLLSYFDSLS